MGSPAGGVGGVPGRWGGWSSWQVGFGIWTPAGGVGVVGTPAGGVGVVGWWWVLDISVDCFVISSNRERVYEHTQQRERVGRGHLGERQRGKKASSDPSPLCVMI